MRNLLISLGLLALALTHSHASAQARAFTIRNDGGSRIQFVSDAPLETITGVTAAVSGDLTLDVNELASARGRVSAQVATIRTGIDLRDEHLRSDRWLDATRFPRATFEITSVSGATAIRPNEAVELEVHGRFTIHGVTKDVTASARVRYVPLTDEMRSTPGMTGDILRIQAKFHVNLTDFGVSVPAIVRLKVSDDILVNVSLRAIAGPAHPAPAATSTAPAAAH